MSVDERLHLGLARNAQSVDPHVELLLESVLTRRRRGLRLRRAGAAAGLLAAACAAAVLGPSGGWVSDRTRPVVPAATPTSAVDLEGRYAGEVAALPSAPSVAGEWVLGFGAKGVLEVTAPPAYPGVVSGVLYAVEGNELRTDLFSQDLCSGRPLGRYEATRTVAGLDLVVADDPCPERVAILSSTSWTVLP